MIGKSKSKFSRFKDIDYEQYDTISLVIGDSMATGDGIQGIASVLVTSSALDGEEAAEESAADAGAPEPDDDDEGPATATANSSAKRAQVLDRLKRNRKRKSLQHQADLKRYREQSAKSLSGIEDSLRLLANVYAAKHGAAASSSTQVDNSSKDETVGLYLRV